jgi:hypothetical protein
MLQLAHRGEIAVPMGEQMTSRALDVKAPAGANCRFGSFSDDDAAPRAFNPRGFSISGNPSGFPQPPHSTSNLTKLRQVLACGLERHHGVH